MRKLIFTSLLCLSTQVLAATGPYYVSADGFCNTREIYIENDVIYGKEVGCSELAGLAVTGVMTASGVFLAYPIAGGAQCIATFKFDNTISGFCSNGTSVSPTPAKTWTLKTSP